MRKSVLNLMTLAGLTAVSGCAGDRLTTAWDKTTSFFNPSSPEEEEISPEFREAQKTFKKNTEKTMLAWARYQEDVGEYAEAKKKYHEIELAYPNNIEASLGIARIELATGRSEEAEKILKQLAAKHPESVPVRVELGALYSSQEEWPQAIEAYSNACALAPEDQGCRYELGVAYAKSGDLDQAFPHLKFAVGGPAAYYNIGYLLHEQGQDAESAEWLRKALTTHPDQKTSESARSLLAIVDPKSLNIHGQDRNSAVAGMARGNARAMDELGSQLDEFAAGDQELPQVVAGASRFGSEEQEPVPAKPSRASVREQFVPAAVSQPVSRTFPPSAVSAEDASPFRTVSHRSVGEQSVQGMPVQNPAPVEQTTGGEPPQWQGPSRSTATPVPSASTPSATVDPPTWRPRRN